MANDPTGKPPRSRLREHLRYTHQTVRAHPTGRMALKIFVAVLGGVVVAIGIALIPLPGPGWLIVIAGLAIWAIEFVWARHLLHFTREKLRGWTDWIKRRSVPIRLLIGALGLAFVGAMAVATLRYSFGVNLVEGFWNYVTTH